MIKKILISLCFLLQALSLSAESPVQADLYADHKDIVPGQEFSLILDVKLDPKWHIYWKNPGDTGMAPCMEWALPTGVAIVDTKWPTPERFEKGETVTFGYAKEAPFYITAKAHPDLKEEELEIKGTVKWVICSDETCLPGTTEFKTKLKVGSQAETQLQDRFRAVKAALPLPLACIALSQDKDRIVLSIEDEIASNEDPLFFPETENTPYKAPLITRKKKGAEITLFSPSEKGVLVFGDKAYDLTLKEQTGSFADFFWALLFAFFGGLILNFMPCVLPVVSLKVLKFAKMAGESRNALIKEGVLFSLGVLVSFLTLAGAIILLQSTGEAVGWGFQLQNPLFIAFLVLIFTLLALNLFGVMEIGTGLASLAGEASSHSASSFWSGIFATAVATPCTGPFMGSALGYALTQPAYITLAIFSVLALGMSLPYLLIGIFPSLIRWFPKPGAWMETFKQILGFPMLATALWLLWVFLGQTSETALFGLLLSLLIGALGAWIFGRFGTLRNSKKVRTISYALTACCLLLAAGLATASSKLSSGTGSEEIAVSDWEPFSEKRIQELRAQGTPVFVDFTAKWCLICQTNHLVLSQTKVKNALKEKGVVKMKADWTRRDPAITKAIQQFGRSGVPLYVYYGKEKEPQILPQILTPESIISSLGTHETSTLR